MRGTPRSQKDLVIDVKEYKITVDDLELAQFLMVLHNNEKLKNFISTITSKAVLILGRFSDARKPMLDLLRQELRSKSLIPIIFDFEPSAQRDLTETIHLLTSISRFVIADITEAKSIPQELSQIVG